MRTFNFDAVQVMSLLNLSELFGERDLKSNPVALLRGYLIGKMPNPRDGYITYFDPGWSVLKIMHFMGLLDTLKGFDVGHKNDEGLTIEYDIGYKWASKQGFAREGDSPSHRQLLCGPLPGSLGLTPADQRKLLAPNQKVPPAREVLMAKLILTLATGDDGMLFQDKALRCSDIAGGAHVYCFDSIYADDGEAEPDIGLAAARVV
jgi:hypothetical protein